MMLIGIELKVLVNDGGFDYPQPLEPNFHNFITVEHSPCLHAK
jgi:hypothetical protein